MLTESAGAMAMEHRTTGTEVERAGVFLGQKFDEALALAAELHRQQQRNDAPVPYLSHLMAVAGIVLEINAYYPMDNLEEVAIGALLHDSVEDQGDKITLNQIRQMFGETVERIVSECSDTIMINADDKKPEWRERKENYLAGIQKKSKETLLVTCADKTHNARCILFDFDRIGDRIWSRFRGGKYGTVWYYESLATEFQRAWPGNPLLPEFLALVDRMKMTASHP
jgi:(p)ppGpp synthase/HD superfamily hydrolase